MKTLIILSILICSTAYASEPCPQGCKEVCIWGKITSIHDVEGVNVTVEKLSCGGLVHVATVCTGGDGFYHVKCGFELGGNYQITATKGDYTFTPEQDVVIDLQPDN